MSPILVNKETCKRDGTCVAICPSRVLERDAEGFPFEKSPGRCIECGHCVAVCPPGALTLHGKYNEPLLPMPSERPTAAMVDGLLMGRRSIRTYKDKPLGRELLAELLDVARRAPTAVNSQHLHWIAVDGKDKVHAVAEELLAGVDERMRTTRALERFAAGDDFLLRNAPTLVLVTAPKQYDWAPLDSAIAATYLELAAEARGIGACWAGYLIRTARTHEPLNQMLGVPAGHAIFAGLMLGWSKFVYKRIPARKPLSVNWV